MKKILIINIFLIFFSNLAFASLKNNIIQNLEKLKIYPLILSKISMVKLRLEIVSSNIQKKFFVNMI